jgi:hypothetical protein
MFGWLLLCLDGCLDGCYCVGMVVSVLGWMFGWLLLCLDGCYCVGMDVWMVLLVCWDRLLVCLGFVLNRAPDSERNSKSGA